MAKAKTITGTIIDAIDGSFGDWFPGDTWSSWRAILKAAFALPMTDDELAFFHQVAEREPPTSRVPRAMGCRRSPWRQGFDRIADHRSRCRAVRRQATHDRRHHIAGAGPGERATIFCLARDRDQAAIALGYTRSYLKKSPSWPQW